MKISQIIKFVIGGFICKLRRKHAIVSSSTYGPDTGEETLWCKRCDREWNTIYY